MKKFLKISGIIITVFILILYFSFLFVLPNVINLNQYKTLVRQIVKEQAHLDLDYGDLKIITTPLLGIGVKTDNITLKYDDGEELLSADKVKAKISLPSLILMTIKVSCFDIENPKINLAIEDGKNLKILQHVEEILLEQEKNIGTKEIPAESKSFDVSKIRIKVPAVKFKNYTVKADDIKNNHNLTLNGEELLLGYFNGKTARIKTNAVLTSDNVKKINANIDINTYLPEPSTLDEEDDKMQRAELPYANVVEIYRKYDLKSDINTKLKIRQSGKNTKLWGHANIDNFSMKFSDYTLPQSYLHTKFRGSKICTDTNLSIAENQKITVSGNLRFDKNPKIDLNINTNKIYFKNVVTFTKAVMDTLHIKNNLASINVNGYIEANTNIKTNLKKLKSDGQIIVRDGSFIDNKTGLNIKNITADILLDNNTLNIKDTKMIVDGVPFYAQGLINEKSIADIKIQTENLPLKGLYKTFAPADVRKKYNFNSGDISLNINLKGELKKAVAKLNTSLNNLSLSDTQNTLAITNDKASADFELNKGELKGTLSNKGLQILLPKTNSGIKNPNLKITVDNENIVIEPSKLFFNNKSELTFLALLSDRQNTKKINGILAGNLNAQDIKQLAGEQASGFIDAKGDLPLKITFDGEGKRQNLFARILADSNNYVTPVNISSLVNKPSSLQAKIAFKGDHFKIKETGLFERENDNLKEIIGLEGTITHLQTNPFINLFTIRIPHDLNIKINGLKNGTFTLGGRILAFGHAEFPRVRGGIYIKDLNISDILTTTNRTDFSLHGRNMTIDVDKLNLNGINVNIDSKMGLEQPAIFTIDELNADIGYFDVDKIIAVTDAISKITPKTSTSSSKTTEIPLEIKRGKIKVSDIQSGNIIISDISGDMNIEKSVLYLNQIKAKAFDGDLFGNISMNLITNILNVKMNGAGLDANKTAVNAVGLKNTITGNLSFNTDFSMNVAAPNFEKQVKSMDSVIDFQINNGQIGPFGKLENMILAENIRESSFFQTAIGGIINNLTTIDTTHFENLNGHIILHDAIVKISPVRTSGNILNLYLIGDFDILKNTLDMKVRAKLGSEISNMLGPIAALNPINLVKSTPGLNVAMAKAFTLFSEEVSADEMDAIPAFKDDHAENFATKFQVVLKGDVAKPLSLVKSFKWLVTSTQMAAAEEFVSTLPEPVVDDNGNLLQTEEEINAYNEYNSKKTTKIKKAVKKLFKRKK